MFVTSHVCRDSFLPPNFSSPNSDIQKKVIQSQRKSKKEPEVDPKREPKWEPKRDPQRVTFNWKCIRKRDPEREPNYLEVGLVDATCPRQTRIRKTTFDPTARPEAPFWVRHVGFKLLEELAQLGNKRWCVCCVPPLHSQPTLRLRNV